MLAVEVAIGILHNLAECVFFATLGGIGRKPLSAAVSDAV